MRFKKQPLYTNKNQTMKTKITTAIIILLSLVSVWGIINSSVHYNQAKASLLENEELKKQNEELKKPSEIELRQARIESLREERIEVQEQIDAKVAYKQELINETNLLKQELSELLGLN